MDQVLEALVNGRLWGVCGVEPQALEDLGLGSRAGPKREHGQGSGDTHRGEEDVLIWSLQNQPPVQAKGKVGVAERHLGGRAALWGRMAGEPIAGGTRWGNTADWSAEASN